MGFSAHIMSGLPRMLFVNGGDTGWIRNSINYYGKKVEFKQGKDIIEKTFRLRKKS